VWIGIAALLVIATVGIALLCWSWMQSTRASQRRSEAQSQRVIELLEEQNALLRRLAERGATDR
jgi:flagellar basal body-associated protein FliL